MNPQYKKPLIIFWSIFGFGVLAVVIFFTLLSYGVLGFMPTFEDLENPKNSLATDIISEDGVTLGKFFVENRSQVDYEDLSPHLEMLDFLYQALFYHFMKKMLKLINL